MSARRNAKGNKKQNSNPAKLEITNNGTIIGTSTNFEKAYFRLGTSVDPSTIRSEETLRKWFPILQRKYEDNRDYEYFCEQMKSIRQDLTVQQIQNEFVVEIYEVHSRVALENNDFQEFTVCLTQLEILYELGIAGNKWEFLSYQLIHQSSNLDFIGIMNSFNIIQEYLSKKENKEQDIEVLLHARKVATSIVFMNYHQFFRLANSAPKHNKYAMRMAVDRMRKEALKYMMKSYRPNLSLEFIEGELGFRSQSECLHYLLKIGVVLNEDRSMVECLESFKSIYGKI